MKIQVRDVVSYAGRDYIVEGVVTYESGGESWQLARAVDGDAVLWIEPPHADADDRLLVLREIRDLEMSVPPPSAIAYHDLTYVQRLATRVTDRRVEGPACPSARAAASCCGATAPRAISTCSSRRARAASPCSRASRSTAA